MDEEDGLKVEDLFRHSQSGKAALACLVVAWIILNTGDLAGQSGNGKLALELFDIRQVWGDDEGDNDDATVEDVEDEEDLVSFD